MGSARRALAVDVLRLVVMDGPDAGERFESTQGRLVVGTHASADVVLSDPAVSRFHFELVTSSTGTLLRDLGSTNGTCVDSVPVIAAPLRPGAVLEVGRTRLRLESASEKATVELPARQSFGVAVGRSVAMARTFALLERAAASDATVLLEGETGTGKEAAAESVHIESARRDQPFIVVDCASIPKDLLESELFGHERGAFTGAVAARAGAFEAANGGTLFLDEIGELSSELQPKLLRVLERREVKRVGANRYEKVDVRLIAATHKNLREEVNSGRFRADLYYRLAVVQVRLPPLRERLDDLTLLVEKLLAQLGASTRPEAMMVRTPEFYAELARHSWPGNVRELRNYVERCLAMRETMPLDPVGEAGTRREATFDPRSLAGLPLKEARDRWVDLFERAYVAELLEAHGDNVAAAARAAGVARNHFYRLLWRHGFR